PLEDRSDFDVLGVVELGSVEPGRELAKDVGVGQVGDVDSATASDADDAEHFERRYRLADHVAAHTQRAGKLELGRESVTSLELVLKNVILDRLGGAIDQALARQRL